MKRFLILTFGGLLVVGAFLLTPQSAHGGFLKSDNPALDESSAPYNNFASCVKCHDTNLVNTGSGSLDVSGLPTSYVPGQSYTLTVTLEQANQLDWGYEFTVLDAAGNAAGFLSNPDGNSQIRTGGGREFASHKRNGTFEGTRHGPVSWTMDWTAPAAGSGMVVVYASGNAADDSDGTGGDSIHNFALACAEDGAANDAASAVIQMDYPDQLVGSARNELARGSDSLRSRIQVRNLAAAADTYTVVTRVRLPNGSFFPATGWLTTDQLALAAGETGHVDVVQAVPAIAPLGMYQLQAMVGFPPATLVTMDTVDFEIIN